MQFITSGARYSDVEKYLLALVKSIGAPWRECQYEAILDSDTLTLPISGKTADEYYVFKKMSLQAYMTAKGYNFGTLPIGFRNDKEFRNEIFYLGSLTMNHHFTDVVSGPVCRVPSLQQYNGKAGGYTQLSIAAGSGIAAAEHGTLEDDQPGFWHGDNLLFNDLICYYGNEDPFGSNVDASLMFTYSFHGLKIIFS